MTDSDPDDIAEELTRSQLEELHQDLLAVRQHLEVLLAAGEDSTKPVELDQSAVGRLSRMDAIQVQQMAVASRRHQELRAGQVGQALRSMQRGDYGCCRRCEEPIGYKRLKARPESPFCLRCQGATESRR